MTSVQRRAPLGGRLAIGASAALLVVVATLGVRGVPGCGPGVQVTSAPVSAGLVESEPTPAADPAIDDTLGTEARPAEYTDSAPDAPRRDDATRTSGSDSLRSEPSTEVAGLVVLSGVAVDANGAPLVEELFEWHLVPVRRDVVGELRVTGAQRRDYLRTDAFGAFELRTRAPELAGDGWCELVLAPRAYALCGRLRGRTSVVRDAWK